MKLSLSIAFAATLLAPVAAGAQSQLPPGTEAPEDAAPSGPPAFPRPQAAGQDPGLATAEEKIDQGDFGGARPLVAAYLAQHPFDARGLFDMGYIDQAVGHPEAAESQYRKAIAADPKQFESRLALGLMLAGENKGEEAREQLFQATLLAPSPPNPAAQAQAFRALAALDRTSDPEVARENLLSALKISPEVPEDLLLTAQIAETEGDQDTAEKAYQRLLAGRPDPRLAASAAAGLAQLLLKEQKYGDAQTVLHEALTRSPDDPSLNAQMATTLLAQGKKSDALPVLEKLRQLEPKNAAVDQMLADAYADAGYPEKADPIYAEMAEARPNDPEVLSGQGRNLIQEKRYSEAEEVLERSLKLKPDDGDAWSGLAFAATENKQYSVALQALSMRAKYLPETASSYYLRAFSYDNLHQDRAAEAYYRKFLASSNGKFPDQEWQANQRLAVLSRSH
jgi:tetratricopeptide (TPR) repeat protein